MHEDFGILLLPFMPVPKSPLFLPGSPHPQSHGGKLRGCGVAGKVF